MFKKGTLLLLVLLVCFSLGSAQNVSPDVGYAIVSPLGGSNLGAFSAVETLFSATQIGVAHDGVGRRRRPTGFVRSAGQGYARLVDIRHLL